jgi:two-component system, OmpR family, phosphate regulon response regulator PhoB
VAKSILVVNNQLGAATILGIMLERNGFTVLRVGDAPAVLTMIEEELTPDVFVISAVLPGINGIELCRQIRLRPCSARVPIIILAVRGDFKEIEQSFEAGADDCLIQPILCHDLLMAVQRVL